MSDAVILDELSELITDEAARIASSARRLKLRADHVATWLAMIIELHSGSEAVSQIRGAMHTPLFRPRPDKTADDLRFMKPRRGKP